MSRPQGAGGSAPAARLIAVGGLPFPSANAAVAYLRAVQERLLGRIITAAHPDFPFLLGLLQHLPGYTALVRCPPVCAFTVRRSRAQRGMLEVCFADASGEVVECPLTECIRCGGLSGVWGPRQLGRRTPIKRGAAGGSCVPGPAGRSCVQVGGAR